MTFHPSNTSATHPKKALRRRCSAWIGIGANLGDAPAALRAAREYFLIHPAITQVESAPLYKTAPIGYDNQPDFLNSVMKITATLSPHGLLKWLFCVENRFLRQRWFKNAPRTLDLDLLAFGNKGHTVIKSDALTLPHPRLHQRAFVLRPLVDISPHFTLPDGTKASALLQTPEIAAQRCLLVADNRWLL